MAQSTRPAIRRTALIDVCAVALILLAALVLRLPTLDLPLNEDGHPFRQTQTAYTSVLFHERGIDLWRPLLPALGPPWQVPFEFPSFQALASLVMDAGVEPELALRMTTLACFAAAAALLWILVRQRASRAEAYIALALFVATPFALLNSRIPSIEYLALAGMLGYLLTALRWREQLRDRWWLAAVLTGSFGLLTKVTTGPFIWLAIVADRPASAPTVMADLRAGRSALRAAWTARSRGPLGGRAGPVWRLVRLAALIAVPIAVVAVWTIHTDRVKQASPLTAPYQSTSLRDWNFGTLAQRFDPAEWSHIGERLVFEFGGPVLVALLVLGVVRSFRRDPQRPFWLAIVAMVVLPLATLLQPVRGPRLLPDRGQPLDHASPGSWSRMAARDGAIVASGLAMATRRRRWPRHRHRRVVRGRAVVLVIPVRPAARPRRRSRPGSGARGADRPGGSGPRPRP